MAEEQSSIGEQGKKNQATTGSSEPIPFTDGTIEPSYVVFLCPASPPPPATPVKKPQRRGVTSPPPWSLYPFSYSSTNGSQCAAYCGSEAMSSPPKNAPEEHRPIVSPHSKMGSSSPTSRLPTCTAQGEGMRCL
ncbi:hypothetical protein ZHAS_00017529 [Anopheles sinensis]|uniref:Uncharacterized protein n=1 Tax=Anopheles sinensis TaxID=74873 RepID=A0A084WGT2_ANOSI|nr:hypothetical protein ZHAS_00017529 [Anopheles sinensis]